MRRKVLVTGGAGFIGSHLVEALVKRGDKVVVIDNLSTGKPGNLASVKGDIEFLYGDVNDYQLLATAMTGVSVIFHEAALGSVPRSIEDPLATHINNANGTLNVLLAAKDQGVKRVVYAASSSAYGDALSLPKVETMPTNPISPYAVSKLVGEQYGATFSRVYGLETVSLRYFNVFGPRQDPESQYAAVIPLFIKQMMSGVSPTINGDGQHSRDFTPVANVVQANLQGAVATQASGRVFNVALGGQVSLNDLVSGINRLLGTDIHPMHAKPRPGDIRHSWADISRARAILDYEPVLTFEEGLEKTVRWFARQAASSAHRLEGVY